MLYRRRRVIIECDGAANDAVGGLVLVDEKRRQEHLERAGYAVVRVVWSDVSGAPAETVARVRAALVRRT